MKRTLVKMMAAVSILGTLVGPLAAGAHERCERGERGITRSERVVHGRAGGLERRDLRGFRIHHGPVFSRRAVR